jgi:small subunit ribosomal protein S6
MKKQRKAHYVLFNIDAPAPAVHEMERQMRLNEDILRHLTIRVDALEEGPSAMMQMRSGRGDDRPRRDDRLRSSPRPAESEDDAPLASDSPDGDAADDADDDAAPDEEGDER